MISIAVLILELASLPSLHNDLDYNHMMMASIDTWECSSNNSMTHVCSHSIKHITYIYIDGQTYMKSHVYSTPARRGRRKAEKRRSP